MNGYKIGDFHLNTDTKELLLRSTPIPLRKKAIKLLTVLCEEGGDQAWTPPKQVCAALWNPLPAEWSHQLSVIANEIKKAIGATEPWIQVNKENGCRLLVPVKALGRGPSTASGDPDEAYRRILEDGLLVKLLERYYRDGDLHAHGLLRYAFSVGDRPVVTHIATAPSWLELEAPIAAREHLRFPICEPFSTYKPVSDDDVNRLHKELEKQGTKFFNKPIYSLRSFDPRSEDTVASFSVAQYADYKIELGRLEAETIRALKECGLSVDAAYSGRRKEMPIRTNRLSTCAVMANYRDRLCAGGTNVLLALRRPDRSDFTFYVKRRSSKVSTGKRVFSLIPSGMHQPETLATAREETSVAATVFREMWEELFGGEDVEGEGEHYAPLWYMNKRPIAWLVRNPNSFTLKLVSFGLNLLDGTFEFGVLLAVTDPRYWDTFAHEIVPNDEFSDSFTPPYETSDGARLASVITDPYLADMSRIALVEGLRRLHQLEPKSVALPDIKIIT
jgi:hypothetical protein